MEVHRVWQRTSEDIWRKIERDDLYWKRLRSVYEGGSIIYSYKMNSLNKM